VPLLFTTSWDDGYAADLRVSALLKRYGLTGTFYVCPVQQHGRAMMTEAEIKQLSTEHEIGAHSMTHPHLPRISKDDVRRELTESKQWVERITGKPCTMFCYPYGDESPEIRSMTRDAGYKGARGTRSLEFSANDLFDLPVSTQIYPFPWRRKGDLVQRILDPLPLLRKQSRRLSELGIPWHARRGWLSLAKALFTHAVKNNAHSFHLFGHSSELDRYEMWHDLEKFLKFVSEHREQIKAVTNESLI
jgi:peptidoglycan/xylan/chitin deacetylase (PgdA/CDA1 family)